MSRVSFSDGSDIVVDDRQLWISHTYKARHHGHSPKIVTTAEIEASLKYGGGIRRPLNHAIQRPRPLSYPRQSHLVDPYVLGAWLGDGCRHNGTIATASWDAPDLLALIEARGYPPKIALNGHNGGNGRLVKIYGDFQRNVRAMDLLFNKHIPESYLRGDTDQRVDLLSGLMDTDGSSANGRCEFHDTNRNLIDGVIELVRSLGCHARVAERKGDPERTLPSGKPANSLQPFWRVAFSPTFNPFRLSRKAATFDSGDRRQRGAAPGKTLGPRQWRTVTSVESAGTADIVRVEVDSPSGLFLAGQELVILLDSTPRARSIERSSLRAIA